MNLKQTAKEIAKTFEFSGLESVHFNVLLSSSDGIIMDPQFIDSGFVIEDHMGSEDILDILQKGLKELAMDGIWMEEDGEPVLNIVDDGRFFTYTLLIDTEEPVDEMQVDGLCDIRSLVVDLLCV